MFVSIDDYLQRIYNTLEEVIAPDLKTDYTRSQLYAVVALLGSLNKKIEYKKDLILNEIKAGKDIISFMVDVLKKNGLDAPVEISDFLNRLEENGPIADTKYIDRVNGQFRFLLDFTYEHRDKIDEDNFEEMDRKIRKYIHDISLRDVGFMAPVSFDKILRPGKKDT